MSFNIQINIEIFNLFQMQIYAFIMLIMNVCLNGTVLTFSVINITGILLESKYNWNSLRINYKKIYLSQIIHIEYTYNIIISFFLYILFAPQI